MAEPNDLSAVERRIRATATVRRIMHAIWVVSRSQYARATKLTTESITYYEWLDDAISRLAGDPVRKDGATLRVVFGPERALCGRLVRELCSATRSTDAYALVGSRLLAHERLRSRAVFATSGVISESAFEDKARELERLITTHAEGRSVELVFAVNARGELHHELLLAERRLLPQARVDSYSPPEQLLSSLIAQAFSGRITHALAQTLQAEVGARVLVAQRARSNCDDRLRKLSDQWRMVQKDQVTTELCEVVAARR